MRVLPNLNVFFPADGAELSEALRFALRAEHPSYISFPKLPDKPLPAHPFEMGKAVRYRDGGDGAVLAIGHSVVEALAAAQALEQQGIGFQFMDFIPSKPFDRSAVLEACATGSLFVVDEHQQCAGIAGEAAKAVLEGERRCAISVIIPFPTVSQITWRVMHKCRRNTACQPRALHSASVKRSEAGDEAGACHRCERPFGTRAAAASA